MTGLSNTIAASSGIKQSHVAAMTPCNQAPGFGSGVIIASLSNATLRPAVNKKQRWSLAYDLIGESHAKGLCRMAAALSLASARQIRIGASLNSMAAKEGVAGSEDS